MYRSITLSAGFTALLLTGTAQCADLVARYVLDGTADDSSGNDFHGVNTDATFVDDPDRGMVASFNGTSSSIDVSASGYSITERPNFQCAISFWLKPTARDDYHPGGVTDLNPVMGAIGSGVIEVVGQGSWHGMGGSSAYGGIGLNSGGGAGSTQKLDAIDLYDGAWHHVVIQWADPDGVPSDVGLGGGADATVYIDNQLADDANGQTYNGNSNKANPTMVLGGPVVWSDGGAANKYYLGLLSDVQFFDDQLTAGEVSDLFTQGSIVPPGLVLQIESSGPNLDFTWDSKFGKVYDLRSATGLTTTPDTWTPWKSDIPATPPTNNESYLRPADPETFFVLVEKAAPPVFADDFETDKGWIPGPPGATGTVWERGAPGGGVGPATGANGSATCFGTNIAANYAFDANITLRSPAIDLTDAAISSATLTFQHFKDIEAAFDFGFVRILRDSDKALLGTDVAMEIDGTSTDWEEFSGNLPPEAIGETVVLEFQFTSDNEDDPAGPQAGWYIDDVAVSVQ